MAKKDFSQMSVDQLVSEYTRAAIIHAKATRQLDDEGKPDVKAYNRTSKVLIELRHAFTARGALDKLLPLVEHENPDVRRLAVSLCVPLDPDRMLALLETIRQTGDERTRLEAGSSLIYWRQVLANQEKT